MTSSTRMTAWLLGIVVGLSITAGCQNPQTTARERAVLRWNKARAQVKVKLAADQFEAGNFDAAEGELARANQLAPDSPELVPLRARIWLAEGRTADAAALLEETQLDGKVQAEVEYLLGIVRQQQQRWDEALEAFTRAAQIDGDKVEYVVAAAQLWLQLGEPREALDYLQDASPKFEWTDAYQAAVAECHEQLGDWSAAASAWQRVEYAEGADAAVRTRLAESLYRSQRYVEAIPVLVELLEDRGDDPAELPRLMLAECYLAEGRNVAACEQVRIVLQWQPDNVRALRLLARGLGAGGEYAAALRVARRALALDVDDAHTLELVTGLAWRIGDNDLAGATAARLLERDPYNPIAQRIDQRLRANVPPATTPE